MCVKYGKNKNKNTLLLHLYLLFVPTDDFKMRHGINQRVINDRQATIYNENKDKNASKKYRTLILKYYGYNKFCFSFRYANFAYEGLKLKIGNL